jgi:SAM-dependent methyltransferase
MPLILDGEPPLGKMAVLSAVTTSSSAVSARAYPDWLDWWWVERAGTHSGKKDAEEAVATYAAAVQKLSDMFTVARPGADAVAPKKSGNAHFPDYGANEEMALGYGLFYFPQNFVRTRLALAEAVELRGWRPQVAGETTRPVRVLDLGAGAGAAGLGAAMLLHERGLAEAVELTAVDHSADNLARLVSLAREKSARLPGLRVRTVAQNALEWARNDGPREAEAFDLVVVGFALNEMLPAAQGLGARLELVHRLRRSLSENGLVLILEPALRETAEPLQELSDALCGKGASSHGPPIPRWGPYLGDHPCPLRAEKKFWNHEVRRWTPPGAMTVLNRKLWREIGELKFAYALHGRVAPPELPEVFRTKAKAPTELTVRLVSPFHLGKGGFMAAGVSAEGVKYTLDLPTRGLAKEEIARLEQIERGDVLALRDLKPLGAPRTMRLLTPAAIAARFHVA